MMIFLIALTTAEIVLMVAIALVGVLITTGLLGRKFGPILAEVKEALQVHRDAKAENSPGGHDITPEERSKLYEERMDVLEVTWQTYGGTIINWITNLFKKK